MVRSRLKHAGGASASGAAASSGGGASGVVAAAGVSAGRRRELDVLRGCGRTAPVCSAAQRGVAVAQRSTRGSDSCAAAKAFGNSARCSAPSKRCTCRVCCRARGNARALPHASCSMVCARSPPACMAWRARELEHAAHGPHWTAHGPHWTIQRQHGAAAHPSLIVVPPQQTRGRTRTARSEAAYSSFSFSSASAPAPAQQVSTHAWSRKASYAPNSGGGPAGGATASGAAGRTRRSSSVVA